MKLTIIDHAIEICDNHLSESGSEGTEIEAYITRYLLVLICASFEEKIEQIVVERARESKDPQLISFVEATVNRIFRSIYTSEMSGLLSKFSPSCKAYFQLKVNNKPIEACYNNIVSNRHDTAHSAGSNLTFRELKESYENCHEVLDYFQEAIKKV